MKVKKDQEEVKIGKVYSLGPTTSTPVLEFLNKLCELGEGTE